MLDLLHLGFSMLLRSAAQLNLPLPVLDPLHLELLLFSRSYVKSDSATSMFGLTRADLVFSPPATDAMHSDFPLPTQSSGRLEPVMPALDLLHLGLVSFLHSFTQTEFSVLLCGLGCSDFVLLLPDLSVPELSLFVRSFARLESSASALMFASLDFSSFLRALAHLDSTLSACRLARLDSPTFALDLALLGFTLFAQSLVRMGLALFVTRWHLVEIT